MYYTLNTKGRYKYVHNIYVLSVISLCSYDHNSDPAKYTNGKIGGER